MNTCYPYANLRIFYDYAAFRFANSIGVLNLMLPSVTLMHLYITPLIL